MDFLSCHQLIDALAPIFIDIWRSFGQSPFWLVDCMLISDRFGVPKLEDANKVGEDVGRCGVSLVNYIFCDPFKRDFLHRLLGK